MKVKDVMTQNPEAIRSDDMVVKAAEVMRNIDVGVVPVFEGDKAVGILTDRDIVVRLVAENKDPESTKAAEIMSQDVVSCSDDTDAREAAGMMEEKKLRRLLVKNDQDKVVGVVSLGDLAVSLNKEAAGEVIQEVSKPAQPDR